MNNTLTIKEGFITDFTVTIRDRLKQPLDLTIYDQIKFIMVDEDNNIIIDSDATFVDKPNGQITYNFVAADVANQGRYRGYFALMIAGQKKLPAPKNYFTIEITENFID